MNGIPHSRPTLDDAEIAAVSEVLRSGRIAQGERVLRFEAELASFVGVKGGVATNSGSAALHLALLALGIGAGDEVIIPGFVCTALLNAVRLVRATPVLADIDGRTLNIDFDDIKRKLTGKSRAIIVPHMFGLPAEIERILALGVPVIEDCAQSLGASCGGKMTGSFGVVSIFSFYATKVICTGEGGMATANDPGLLEKMRDLRDYDEKEDGTLRYNYKLTELQAAMGLVQLGKLPGLIARRREIARKYTESLSGLAAEPPFCPPGPNPIHFRYIIKTSRQAALLESGKQGGIGYRRPVYKPLHRYLNMAGFPVTEEAFARTVSIPLYPALTDSEVDAVIDHLRRVLG